MFDHHCPWLNQCVGHYNRRYFFLYMVYTVIGVIFIIFFGIGIGYEVLWLGDGGGWQEFEELRGSPVRMNLSGHIIPVTELEYSELGIAPAKHDLPVGELNDPTIYKCVVFMAVICVSTFIALGALAFWHFRLISRGETSVESHVNKSEMKRLVTLGKNFVNPYDFGRSSNWRLFLGLTRGRSFWRHVLLPSIHEPEGDGIRWMTVYDEANFHANEHQL